MFPLGEKQLFESDRKTKAGFSSFEPNHKILTFPFWLCQYSDWSPVVNDAPELLGDPEVFLNQQKITLYSVQLLAFLVCFIARSSQKPAVPWKLQFTAESLRGSLKYRFPSPTSWRFDWGDKWWPRIYILKITLASISKKLPKWFCYAARFGSHCCIALKFFINGCPFKSIIMLSRMFDLLE